MSESEPCTVVDRIVEEHLVAVLDTGETVLYVDQHYLNEVSSAAAFDLLRRRRLAVRRPDSTLAVADHRVPSGWPAADPPPPSAPFLDRLEEEANHHGIRFQGPGDPEHGIIHVVGPSTGRTVPGMVVASGDSHTPTQGAIGALGFGLAGPEVAQVLATQCVVRPRLPILGVRILGELRPGVGAKDLVLHLLRAQGANFARGHIMEYHGSGISSLGVEDRAVLCNMAVECGAASAIVGVDQVTLDHLASIRGLTEDQLTDLGRFRSDRGAVRDMVLHVSLGEVRPMVTYGTSPSMCVPITTPIDEPADDAEASALDYMDLSPGEVLAGRPVDVIFVGSCANGWAGDLRVVASMLRGQRVHPTTRLLVVPASESVRQQATREGTIAILEAAGAYVGQPGCSMCTGTNGDSVPAGQYCLSTSNRNHRNRQGVGARTILCSPATAAASALTGRVTDPSGLFPS